MSIFSFLGGQSKPVVGIDITSSTVKLLELSQSGGRYKVESYAVKPLPANTVIEKNIHDVEALAGALRELMNKAKTKTKDVAVAVAGSAVITKVIEMPGDLSEEGLESQLAVDADQHIPFPIDEVALDFELLGPSEANPDQIEVLLAACRRETVDLRTDALLQAGLNPKIVDMEVFALERIFEQITNQLEDVGEQIIAIVDIGATMMTLSVFLNGSTLYTREQMFGGQQVTDEIESRYGLSREEAGQAKKQGGLPEDYEAEILVPFKKSLIEQISRSLQFFYSSSHYNYVDQIVLAGGVAAMEGLVAQVGEQLNVPAIMANPFADMSVSNKVDATALAEDAPAMLVATGLALRSFT